MSNARLTALVPDQIWHAQDWVRFGPISLRTRATIVRLSDRSLWVHSPVAPNAGLRDEIRELGTVEYIVAPNKSHHLFFRSFAKCFPEAKGFIAPGLAEKRPDLQGFAVLGAGGTDWQPDLQAYFVRGLPVINETVWFHERTGTLITTDLLFNIGEDNPALLRLAARGLGVYRQLAMSRTMKLLIKDKPAFRASVEPLLRLPIKRIIVAHDTIVEDDARAQMSAAFAWLTGEAES
ncbi:MAG: DUF4336 domain-containing protein [Rhodospirillaceae bacterium]